MTDHPARQALAAALGETHQGLSNFVLRGTSIADAGLARFDLDEDLASAVFTDVVAAAVAVTRKQIVPYDPSYVTNSSQVLVEKLEEVPELAILDRLIRAGDAPDDDGGENVVAMIHAVGFGRHQVVAIRMKGPGIATRRQRGIPLLPRDGVYGRLQGQVLYYEPRFDAFTLGGYVYFSSAYLIQSKLHAVEKARQLARKALKQATENVKIVGFDKLEIAVMDDPNLRAKMAQIARTLEADPGYRNFLTTEKLVEFVEANPGYEIPLATVDGKSALEFVASPQHRHQIPRLLADDYLYSFLTNRRYEAGSKSPSASQE